MVRPWNLGYERSKSKAKGLYKKIGRVECPALNGELVSFTSNGFDHIVRKGRALRTKTEQKKRFALVPYLKGIVGNPAATIVTKTEPTREVVDRHGNKVTINTTAQFWAFYHWEKGFRIKVVVRQLGTGPKHFFSVMGQPPKTKKARRK